MADEPIRKKLHRPGWCATNAWRRSDVVVLVDRGPVENLPLDRIYDVEVNKIVIGQVRKRLVLAHGTEAYWVPEESAGDPARFEQPSKAIIAVAKMVELHLAELRGFDPNSLSWRPS